ncbi:unnamed protein product, partial [Thlaspi arvense]
MPKRNDEKFVFDDGEDEDREDPVAIRDGSDEDEDDEEANEDLSLKILEKALSRRDSKETSMSDLCGSGVVSTVMVNGGTFKKMTRNNLEDTHQNVRKFDACGLMLFDFFPKLYQSITLKDQEEDNMVEELITKGEEDVDDEVERSAEPKPGETSSNMVLKKLLRGARYFDPPDAGWVSCYSCGEQGHITVNCPTPTKRRKPCFICGSLEHGAKQCTKGHDCYICKKGGHRAKDCPDKYKSGSKRAVCLRCGDFGHDMILCKYEYSKDDLKDIQCYVCKSFGHLCCVEPGNTPSWAVSCYRCGQLGHIGLVSKRSREPSTPSSKPHKKIKENPEDVSTPLESNGKTKKKKKKKKNKENSELNSTPHESNGMTKTKKKKKENSEPNSTPHESNGKTKKKKSHKGEQSQTTPHISNHRGGWMREDLEEEDSFQRGKIRRPRSPITPSGHNHHRSPITPSGHNHHRSPIKPLGRYNL